MTVSTTVSREQYATDGVTVAFTIHFGFFDDTDINAIFVDSGGVSTTFALTTDFSVTGGAGAGGTLTTVVAPATGGTLTIFREIPYTAEIEFVENDPLPAASLNEIEDRAAMRDQQLLDATSRSLTFPVTIDPTVSAVLPTPSANQVLGWDSTGLLLENKNLPAGTAVYSSTANTNTGTATAEAVTPKGLHDSIYNSDDVTVAVTGNATAVTTGTGKETFRVLRKGTITGVRASLAVAQASGSILTIDINKNGTSIMAVTKLTIDNTEKTSVTAATPAVLTTTALAVDDEISFDVDQIGDGTALGLKGSLLIRTES